MIKRYDMARDRFARDYPRIREYFTQHGKLLRAVAVLSKLAVILTYGMYAVGLILSIVSCKAAYGNANSTAAAVSFTISAFAAFMTVTVIRKLINAPRPYERGIEPLFPKQTKGLSCPSRHTACVTAIALSWLVLMPPVGAAMLVVAAFIGVSRIIAGVHYPLDVLFGAVLSVLIYLITAAVLIIVGVPIL